MKRDANFLQVIKEADQSFKKMYLSKEELIYDYLIEITTRTELMETYKKNFDFLNKKDQKSISKDIISLQEQINTTQEVINHLHQIV